MGYRETASIRVDARDPTRLKGLDKVREGMPKWIAPVGLLLSTRKKGLKNGRAAAKEEKAMESGWGHGATGRAGEDESDHVSFINATPYLIPGHCGGLDA